MSDVEDMLLLLLLCAAVVLWLKLTAARERAMVEARRQCEKRGLQLLDESVSQPTVELASAETIVATALVKASSNVVPLHPNRRPPNERLH
jgi:hypothetical protein